MPDHPHPDDDLLELARSGPEGFRRAATTAFRRHFRELYAHVRGRLPEDEAATQDVLQEVALAVVEGMRRVRGGAALRPWMLQIASHKVCDHLRRVQRTRARQDAAMGNAALDHLEDPHGSIDVLLERAGEAQLAAYLRRAVDQLNHHQRRAVELVYFEGVDPTAAAAELGLRTDALASLLYRARKAFMKRLARDRGNREGDAQRRPASASEDGRPSAPDPRSVPARSNTARTRTSVGSVPAGAMARK